MKKILLVLAVIMVVLTGCNRKSETIEYDVIIKGKDFDRVNFIDSDYDGRNAYEIVRDLEEDGIKIYVDAETQNLYYEVKKDGILGLLGFKERVDLGITFVEYFNVWAQYDL